jgi:hypothetical protein
VCASADANWLGVIAIAEMSFSFVMVSPQKLIG